MHQPIAGAALTPRPAAVSGHAMPVLLVEEDAAIAAVTAEILTDAGYQMDHVAAPAAALALVAQHGPHADGLVLSDAFDPNHTQAYTWCDRLQTVTAAPVVLWSTAPRQVYADDRVHGAAAVVSTPFDIDELLALLATLVPHARAGR